MSRMTTDEVVGRNVHHMMWDRRIRQRRVYEAMGLSRGSLAKKLRGEVTWSADDIATAARIIGVDPGRLFIDSVPEPRSGGEQTIGLRSGVVVPIRPRNAALARFGMQLRPTG